MYVEDVADLTDGAREGCAPEATDPVSEESSSSSTWLLEGGGRMKSVRLGNKLECADEVMGFRVGATGRRRCRALATAFSVFFVL